MKSFGYQFLVLLSCNLIAANAVLAQPRAPSGVYRLLPQTEKAGGPELLKDASAGHAELPDEPFVRPKDGVRFAVFASDGTDANNGKLLLLNGTFPKIRGSYQNSAQVNACGTAIQTTFDRECLTFSSYGGDGFCRASYIAFRENADGVASVESSYSTEFEHGGRMTSKFERFGDQKYLDIIKIVRDVPFYSTPAYDSEVLTNLASGNYVALTSIHPEWLRADFPHADGTVSSGWLAHRDLVSPLWAQQQADDGHHTFRVAYQPQMQSGLYSMEPEDAEPDLEAGIYWQMVEVTSRKTGKVNYIFYDSQEPVKTDPKNLLDLVDINFDGHVDLRLFGGSGGAGPNSSSAYFLYDKASDQFNYHEEVSDLTQLEIDARSKTLHAAWRASCCEHGWATYRWRRGELLKFAEGGDRYTQSGDKSVIEITESRLKRGKWRTHVRRERVTKTE